MGVGAGLGEGENHQTTAWQQRLKLIAPTHFVTATGPKSMSSDKRKTMPE